MNVINLLRYMHYYIDYHIAMYKHKKALKKYDKQHTVVKRELALVRAEFKYDSEREIFILVSFPRIKLFKKTYYTGNSRDRAVLAYHNPKPITISEFCTMNKIRPLISVTNQGEK